MVIDGIFESLTDFCKYSYTNFLFLKENYPRIVVGFFYITLS